MMTGTQAQKHNSDKSQIASELDQSEWNSLFVQNSQMYWDSLLRFAISLTSNKSLAEDILQTSLLKGIKAYPSFVTKYVGTQFTKQDLSILNTEEVQYHFKNWLYKIIKNTFLDNKDSEKKWKFDQSEDLLTRLSDNAPQPTPSFQKQNQQNCHFLASQQDFYASALDDQWKKHIDTLNSNQKSALYLMAEGYSYKEIAAILDIPIGTVMSTLSRTIQKLKKTQSSPVL